MAGDIEEIGRMSERLILSRRRRARIKQSREETSLRLLNSSRYSSVETNTTSINSDWRRN